MPEKVVVKVGFNHVSASTSSLYSQRHYVRPNISQLDGSYPFLCSVFFVSEMFYGSLDIGLFPYSETRISHDTLVMEVAMPRGLNVKRFKITKKTIQDLLLQLIELDSLGLCHGDIKGDQILKLEEKHYLTDFGSMNRIPYLNESAVCEFGYFPYVPDRILMRTNAFVRDAKRPRINPHTLCTTQYRLDHHMEPANYTGPCLSEPAKLPDVYFDKPYLYDLECFEKTMNTLELPQEFDSLPEMIQAELHPRVIYEHYFGAVPKTKTSLFFLTPYEIGATSENIAQAVFRSPTAAEAKILDLLKKTNHSSHTLYLCTHIFMWISERFMPSESLLLQIYFTVCQLTYQAGNELIHNIHLFKTNDTVKMQRRMFSCLNYFVLESPMVVYRNHLKFDRDIFHRLEDFTVENIYLSPYEILNKFFS